MNRSLFKIGDDLLALDDLLEEQGGDLTMPEAEQAVDQWLSELQTDLHGKLDRYARYIADLEARADAKRAEVERLQERVHIEENRAKWLKGRLLEFFRTHGLTKVETPLHRFSVARNGGKLYPVLRVAPAELPERFRFEFVTYKANTDDLRDALECGDPEAQAVAEMPQRGFHLRVA